MVSAPEYAMRIGAILDERKLDRLSRSALEVLSIVADVLPNDAKLFACFWPWLARRLTGAARWGGT